MHTICNTRETGVLYLSRKNFRKDIYIEEGKVVFASSNDPDERLGELLMREGILSYERLEDAITQLGKGKRLGAILVEKGYITAEKLFEYVVEQVKQIVFSAFQWNRGEYVFEMGDLPSKEVIKLQLSTQEIILEGIKHISKWSIIRDGVGNLDTIYCVAEDSELRSEGLTLTSGEETLIELVKEHKSLRNILKNSKLDSFSACQLIWALHVIGILKKQTASSSPEKTAVSAETPPVVELGENYGDDDIDSYLGQLDSGKEELQGEADEEDLEEEEEEEEEGDAQEKEDTNKDIEVDIDEIEEQQIPEQDELTTEDEPHQQEEFSVSEPEQPYSMETAEAPPAAAEIPVPELSGDIAQLESSLPAGEESAKKDNESVVSVFNKRHSYLYKFLKGELGSGIDRFVNTAISGLDAGHRKLLDGLRLETDGTFPHNELMERIESMDIKFPGISLTSLIRKELELAGLTISGNRLKIIELGLKKIRS